MRVKTAVQQQKLLLIPISLYLILSFLYLMAIPVGESPDEPGHVVCIEQVIFEQQIPHSRSTVDESILWWSRENIFSEYMCYHMPLYYLLGGATVQLVTAVTGKPYHFTFPSTNPAFDDDTLAMFVHPVPPELGQLGQPFHLISLRILSIMAGLVTLIGTYIVSGRLFPQEPYIPPLATTLIAGWPQFLFISRAISNDGLATALAVMTLVVLSQTGSPRRLPWAALLSVLAFLTKLSVAFTVGIVAVVWLVEWRFIASEKRPYWWALFWMVIIWIGTIGLLCFQSTLWGNLQYSFQGFSGIAAEATMPAYWQQVYAWTLSSGWAWFGWLNLMPSAVHGQIWWFFIQITFLLGLYLAWKKWQHHPGGRFLLFLLLAWCVAILFSYIRVTANRWQPQFRFALAILPVLTTLSARGLLFLSRDVYGKYMFGLMAVGLFAYNLWLILSLVLPTYQ
jgi:hypothetical protein